MCSLPTIHLREKKDVSEIHDGRCGRLRVAGDHCVCAIADHHHRPRQHGASSTTNASYQGDWRTSKLVGLNVYNNNNESVGSINDLLTDKNGTIKAAVIGVGGLLGVGEHLVAVSFDQIKFVDTPVPSATASTAPPASTSSTTTTGAAGTTAPASTSATSMTTTKSNPWYPDHAVYNATKDQLKQMPEFKYSTN